MILGSIVDRRSLQKGGRAATFGGNMMKRNTGCESSYREFSTILGSIVDPGTATSASAQVGDQECGRKKETGGGNLRRHSKESHRFSELEVLWDKRDFTP